MNRITNEQREHIVREAVAQRDAILAGSAPRKLWLWRNFVDGKPEYWAFDNPSPINLTDGDPQTLGEPCGYAIFKPSRNGRPDVPEEKVLARIAGVTSCPHAKPRRRTTVADPIKDRAALESSLRFIDEHVKPRRCDSDGVSHCWHCNSVYIAKRMRELLAERDADGVALPRTPLTDEAIEKAWWSLGTEPDGSNLAGGTNLEGWTRAIRWAEQQHGIAGVDVRSCTCYPDDTRPEVCQRKFALSECRAAAGLPDLFPPGGNAGVEGRKP